VFFEMILKTTKQKTNHPIEYKIVLIIYLSFILRFF
jgi:hypothetical protein